MKPNLSQWLHMQSEHDPQVWTVGFYSPDGTWEAESDHSSIRDAGDRVAYLNGGQGDPLTVSGYSATQVVEFLRRVYCLERDELVEFFTWVNNGTTPADLYVEEKWAMMKGDPGMFICNLDPNRAEKFMSWVLSPRKN